MRLKVKHRTSYFYSTPVTYGLQQVRKTPKQRQGQNVLDWNVSIEGGSKQLEFTDQHANHVDLVRIDDGAHQVIIDVTGEVETSDASGIVGRHQGFMPLWLFKRPTVLTSPGPKVRALQKELGTDFDSDIAQAHALSALIIRHVPYETGTTHPGTGAEEAMGHASGVCQDHAHIFVSVMRLLGHPARYVSGYLMMDDRVEQDATHAWAEAWFDGVGWVGFDVSNGYSPDERYIRVATGLDYNDAAPVSGLRYGLAEEQMLVDIQVQQ